MLISWSLSTGIDPFEILIVLSQSNAISVVIILTYVFYWQWENYLMFINDKFLHSQSCKKLLFAVAILSNKVLRSCSPISSL
jgi:hypothetical protein